MKKFLLIITIMSCISAWSNEIIFIPGWRTQNVSSEKYASRLNEIFPGKKITVLKWNSNVEWDDALNNSTKFVPDVVNYICSKPDHERRKIILIGHSLGGRISIKTTEELTKRNVRIKQVILLGAAIRHNVNLDPLIKATLKENINIFSNNDSVLKFAYGWANQKKALGFCGAKNIPKKRFIQYQFRTSEALKSNTDLLQALIESTNHFVYVYFDELKSVISGKAKPYTPKYDYSNVTVRIELPHSLPFRLEDIKIPPVTQVTILDSYAGWIHGTTVISTPEIVMGRIKIKEKKWKIYLILDHLGGIRAIHICDLSLEFNKIKKQIIVL